MSPNRPAGATTKEDWLKSGDARFHYRSRRFEEALADYEQALQLDPTFAAPLSGKAEALSELQRYKEAPPGVSFYPVLY